MSVSKLEYGIFYALSIEIMTRLCKAHGFQNIEPGGKRKGAAQGGEHDHAGTERALVPHVARHNETADCGGTGQHGQCGDELVLPEAQSYGNGNKEGGKAHQFQKGGGCRGLPAAKGALQIEGGAQGHQAEGRGGG